MTMVLELEPSTVGLVVVVVVALTCSSSALVLGLILAFLDDVVFFFDGRGTDFTGGFSMAPLACRTRVELRVTLVEEAAAASSGDLAWRRSSLLQWR